MKSSTKLNPFNILSRNKLLKEVKTPNDLLLVLPKFKNINVDLIDYLNNLKLGYLSKTQFEYHIQQYQKETSQFKTLFWTRRGYTEYEAKDIISTIQSKNSKKVNPKRKDQNPMCIEYYIKKGLSQQEALIKVEEMKGNTSSSRLDFWINKGYTKQEAIERVSELQSKRASEYWSSPESENRLTQTQFNYWAEQGFSEQEAKRKVSEIQSTFSKEICIQKYGNVEGLKIFNSRQAKWQETLNSKPQEEIDRINQKKSTGRMSQYFKGNPEAKNVPGVLYYLRFFNKETEFWKIGITSKSIEERFSKKHLKSHNNLEYEILKERTDLTFGECFKEEQRILKKFKEFRINVYYNEFHSTECFSKDILFELNNYN